MPVKEITIVSEDESEECIFHIIFTPAGNIFRYINEDPFEINIDERINISCDSIDIAWLIYNSSMIILHYFIERLENLWRSEESELNLGFWQDSGGLSGLTYFNGDGSF